MKEKLIRKKMLFGIIVCSTLLLFSLAIGAKKRQKLKFYAEQAQDNLGSVSQDVYYMSEGNRISAKLYLPVTPTKGYIVFAHGNRKQGKSHPFYRKLTSLLGAHYVTLAFDFRGYGDSEKPGPYESGMRLDFSSDIIEGVKYISERFNVPLSYVILVGHSFGSVSVILAGKRLKSRIIVPLGVGDPKQIFESDKRTRVQINKLKKLGLIVPLSDIKSYYEPLFAENLFEGCFSGDMVCISGGLDSGLSTLDKYIDRINKHCDHKIKSFTLPFADHMFWSENHDSFEYRILSIFIHREVWVKALAGSILLSLKER